MTRREWLGGTIGSMALAAVDAGSVAEARLRPETVQAWTTYAVAVERRREMERGRADRFLVADYAHTAAADRRALLAGHTVLHAMDPKDLDGANGDIPSGMVHHWRGAILLRGAALDDVLAELERRAPPPDGEDVLASSVLAHGPDSMRVFLRLRRAKIVTAVYDTEHDVRFARISATRAETLSRATRIAEVDDPGLPTERIRTPGDDRGFLWRLNAYWRYEAVTTGVIAECESISLSRDVPFGLSYVVGPIVRSTARESLARTLLALRNRMTD